MIRRWRETKAAAESATTQAGLQKLEEVTQARTRRAEAVIAGDTETTVGDLVDRVPTTPAVMKLAPRTREGYHYTLIVPAIVVACWWAWRARVGPWAWVALALALILLGAPLPYMDAGLKAGWLALLAYPRVYGSYLLWGWLGWALAHRECSTISGKVTVAEDRG
jgi:hypothetical protein